MTDKILDVDSLTTRLQIGDQTYKVVDQISFDIKRGKTLALVGESGSGKTMTALSLLRILPSTALPPTGKVFFQDKNLLDLPEHEMRHLRGKQLAMIFQDPTSALNPVYTAGEQILESIRLHLDLDDDEAKEKTLKAMSDVGIPSPMERYDEYPHQLSGGLKQRVMIAMALACHPQILIADEPTTALDATIQAQVLMLIRELQKANDMSLLLVTHDMGVVAEMADEVIVMYASEAVEKGSVHDIFDRMAHPYTRGLFESRPHAKGRQETLNPIKGAIPSLENHPPGCKFHPRCPYAMEKCRQGIVPEFTVGENHQHISRCWLHDNSKESAEKLKQIGGVHASTS